MLINKVICIKNCWYGLNNKCESTWMYTLNSFYNVGLSISVKRKPVWKETFFGFLGFNYKRVLLYEYTGYTPNNGAVSKVNKK